jgi:dolichyl-phosphate beta-glucosyltransferase
VTVTNLDPSPYLSVVIPAYNEERRLPTTLRRILDYLAQQPYTSEVIVADDGSSMEPLRMLIVCLTLIVTSSC